MGKAATKVEHRNYKVKLERREFECFLRASDSPIAMACFRLLTRPPLPALPDRSVPCFFRCIALLTFPAALPYLGIVASSAEQQIAHKPYRDETRTADA